MRKLKIIVVLSAYDAQETLEKTIKEIPKKYVNEIILVDDGSLDNTFAIKKFRLQYQQKNFLSKIVNPNYLSVYQNLAFYFAEKKDNQ